VSPAADHQQLCIGGVVQQAAHRPIPGDPAPHRDIRVALLPAGQPLRQQFTLAGFDDIPVDNELMGEGVRAVGGELDPGVHGNQVRAPQ
jgi:hypothetical protein